MLNKIARLAARMHKVIGLAAGIFMLFWVCSGLYFTIFPIETIHGDHLRAEIDHGILEPEEVIVSVQDAINASGIWGYRAELKMFMGQPVWLVSNTHDKRMVDAKTGRRVSPVSEDLALEIARKGVPGLASYGGHVFLLKENSPREYSGPLPVWVYETEHAGERAYIDASTGEIKAVRTTEWRLFDILWRFHILDVTGADSFNTWWLTLAALIALSMILSGVILLLQRTLRGRLFS